MKIFPCPKNDPDEFCPEDCERYKTCPALVVDNSRIADLFNRVGGAQLYLGGIEIENKLGELKMNDKRTSDEIEAEMYELQAQAYPQFALDEESRCKAKAPEAIFGQCVLEQGHEGKHLAQVEGFVEHDPSYPVISDHYWSDSD